MIRIHRLAAVAALLVFCAGAAGAQTTAFTHQGKLIDAGNPANGNYDLQYQLFDTALVGAGAQQGPTVVQGSVAVSAGVFTVALDFGAQVFDGADRYLQIGVRPAGSIDAFTVLAPRQPVTSVPYAVQARNAQQLDGLPAGRYVATDADGNVRIGTAAAANAKLHAAGGSGNGLYGDSNGGRGVWGESNSYQGVFGKSNTNAGVVGEAVLFHGVYGVSHSANNAGVYGTNDGSGFGVAGYSLNGRAVDGYSGSAAGVAGKSIYSYGVYGESDESIAVAGVATYASGVYGQTAAASLTAAGVFGKGTGSGSIGVIGESNVGTAVGVFGVSKSPTGFGVYARNNDGGPALLVDGPVASASPDGVTMIADLHLGGALHAGGTLHAGSGISLEFVPNGGDLPLCWKSTTHFIANCFASSLRYKQDVHDLRRGLEIVTQLRPIAFAWKEDGRHDIGFAAEEVDQVEPLLAFRNRDGEIDGVKYQLMGVVLVKAVQEQQIQIEKQQLQINQQRMQIESLKGLICLDRPAAELCRR